ncbi:MAG: pyridoxal-phosphate dependent enzyme [Verrucomicrobiae bacterium]|nr:pyridoxal-phosphate dependent enzyme [Verrucomicrobiae bacterium]
MPFAALGTCPTPVERLAGIERALGTGPEPRRPVRGTCGSPRGAGVPPTFKSTELWVKRDDLSGEPWGMSKVRKLEHYFGEARSLGARRVLTFGPFGSNHALATALYGRQLGFEVHLHLWPEPMAERVRQTLLAEQASGANLFLVGALGEQALVDLSAAAVVADRSLDAYVIPPAGTDPVGAMGYVEAGLELGEQVARGELPAPDFVHVAGGTGGVAAGLVVGLRLAGLRARVVAVRCVAAEVLTELRIVFLARRLCQRLARLADVAEDSLPQPVAEDFLILHDHAGGGYGRPTEEAARAASLFAAHAGLTLDVTYTAKAAAGLLAFATSAAGAGRRHLFFHTYAHRDLAALAGHTRWEDLPAPFRAFLDGQSRQRGRDPRRFVPVVARR